MRGATWGANRVQGGGPLPAAAGTCSGALLVIGGGRCLWDDLGRLPAAMAGAAVMAVNHAGLHYPGTLHHWASLHADCLGPWRQIRRTLAGECIVTHANAEAAGVDIVWRVRQPGHASGLFACMVGLALGYERIVLAGVPSDDTGHFYDPPGTHGNFRDTCAPRLWAQARDHVFAGRVTSLSGRTRDWLGAPA